MKWKLVSLLLFGFPRIDNHVIMYSGLVNNSTINGSNCYNMILGMAYASLLLWSCSMVVNIDNQFWIFQYTNKIGY